MDINTYLSRIGYDGSREACLATLQGMQQAHFYRVPFENLDISHGRRIEVNPRVNYEKVVGEGRGGFCLELNALFAEVLRAMGYRVDVLSARVFTPDGALGPAGSHMTLVVHLDEPWIADVGFGGRIGTPLRMYQRGVQVFDGRKYVVDNDRDHWFVTAAETGNGAQTYVFAHEPREYREFEDVCDWLQTSPDSRFTQGPMVSLATKEGRRTLAGNRLILTTGESREEREIAPQEQPAILKEHFSIVYP